MKLFCISLLCILTGCASKQQTVTTVTHGVNGKPVSTQTRQLFSSKQFTKQQETNADVAIANATAECWKAQANMNQASQFNIPSGLSAETMVSLMAVTGLVQSNIALANASKPNVIPCSNVGTNSNDVAIIKEQGKTQRSLARTSVVPKLLGIAGATIAGVAAIDAFSDVAVAGLNAAGNRTTTNVTGDNNRANTTSQEADNASTISDSGNYTEAGGIPVGETDLALTASDPVVVEPDAVTEISVTEDECIAQNGAWREASLDEITAGLAIDGFVCSDGMGGLITVAI